MSEEMKIVELKEEDLEKVTGGTVVTASLFYRCNKCGYRWLALTIQSSAYEDQLSYYFDPEVEKTCPECGKNNCMRFIATNSSAFAEVCKQLELSF